MKIMMILLLTALSISARANVSDVEVGSRLHELFCAVPGDSLAEVVLSRSPNTTMKQLQELLEMKSALIESLKTAAGTAAKFDRNAKQFVAIYGMLQDRNVSASRYEAIRSSEIGRAYVACQTSELMRHRLERVGCNEAGLSARDLKPTLSACDRLMSKTQALSRGEVEK